MPITNRNIRSTSMPRRGRYSSSTRPRCSPTVRAAGRFSAPGRCSKTSCNTSAAAVTAAWCSSATAPSCRPSGPIAARRSTPRRSPVSAMSSTLRWTTWCARRPSRGSFSMPRSCGACSRTASTKSPISKWASPTSRRSKAGSSSISCRIVTPGTAATKPSSSPVRTSVPTVTTRASAATCSMPRRRSSATTC